MFCFSRFSLANSCVLGEDISRTTKSSSVFLPYFSLSIASLYGFVFDFNRVEDDQYPQHKHSRDDDD